jgi:hypothetical protein
VRVQVPERAHNLLREIVNTARRAGVRVRQSKYVRPDPVLPQALLILLGRRSSACEEADAVAIGARLAAALGRPVPPVGAAATSHLSISPRLAARLRCEPPAPPSVSARPPPTARKHDRPTLNTAPPDPRDQVSARPAGARQGKLSLITIGKLRLLALPRLPAVAPSPARSALRSAASEQAHRRAANFAKAGFGSSHSVEQLGELLKHASDLADFGASHGTRRKNEAAWAQWEQFAALVGFDPLLSSEQVQNHASEVGTLLATFLLYVYPKMKGKRGREWASPRSAFAYVLSIIRIFREWKLILPPPR